MAEAARRQAGMTLAGGTMAGKAPRCVPNDFLDAAQTLKAAARAPSRESMWSALDITDLGWAAIGRHEEGAANPCVSLHGTVWPARIDSFTSPEGMLVTPVRQFFRAPLHASPARGVREMERLDSSTIRFKMEDLARMDPGELALLLGEFAFAATDYEAVAIRQVALGRCSRRYGLAGSTASISPSVVGINCGGRLTEGIAEGAEILRDRGYGGLGLVVYEPLSCGPLEHTCSQRPVVQYAGISVGYRIVQGRPRTWRAGDAGIVRVRSRALDQPPATDGPPGQYNASIMFDPYAAFALRAAPRLWLEAWREWGGHGLSVKATHTVCVDMNQSAVCLLFHEGTQA